MRAGYVIGKQSMVYDGSLSLPSSYAYLEFVFVDGYVEVYDGKDSKYVYYLQDNWVNRVRGMVL